MVGIVHVARELFNELEKLAHESIINPFYLVDQLGQFDGYKSWAASSDRIHGLDHVRRSPGFIRWILDIS